MVRKGNASLSFGLVGLAISRSQINDTDRAINVYKLALEKNPNQTWALVALKNAQFKARVCDLYQEDGDKGISPH